MSWQDRKTINRYLGNRGLATLDDPQGLTAQLGFLVESDQHLKQLINKCEPQYRREMYEALRPHLHFTARPLDEYVSELGLEAEIQQLPTVDQEGKFHAFTVQNIRTVVEETISDQHLELTCRRCTRSEIFHGGRRIDAIYNARQAGWTYDPANGGSEICPKCD